MEDHDYPAWVWTLVAPEKGARGVEKAARTDKDARRDLQRASTNAIKAANTLKAK